ncbi:MAG: mechanosensitive ion channel family protein [Candidatus Hydrogenedentes bacterium]|nr:mechanosensitive ion channel family protein [Candidatus Hydrogenedentota bacterium]
MGINKQKQTHKIFTPILFLMVLAMLSSVTAQQPSEAIATEQAAINLSSPRETVRSFYKAMGSVKAGNVDRLTDAIACLYLGEELTENELLNKGSEAAEKLYIIFDHLQFRIEDIAEEVEGDSYTAELGIGDEKVQLKLHRYEDKQWRFNSETLSEDRLAELEEAGGGEEGEEEEQDQFQEQMKSPRAAMMTFLRGINETDGFTSADALETLDLRHITASVRKEVGLELAYQLKSVIDRYKYVEISELPPNSKGSAYIFLTEPAGRIVLDVVSDEETEQKAWKFTKATLDSVESLYLKYKNLPLIQGVEDIRSKLPLYIRVRDWVNDTAPFMTNQTVYLQNWQWLGLFVIILFGMAVSRLISAIFLKIIRHRFHRKQLNLNEKLGKDFVRPIRIALMAWFWLLGLTLLGAPPEIRLYLRVVAQVITAFGAVWAVYRLIDIFGSYLQERATQTQNKFDDLLAPIMTRSLKIFVIVIAIIFLSDKIGQDPTKLVAGLGLGGLAFALAAKDVVANIFGSFTILLDRPFQIGDWVTIGDVDGTVEAVGMRSTRVRTFYNSLITVPNSELIGTSIDNWGKRKYRRIKSTVSIAYDTPAEKIDAFCEGIRQLIRNHPYTRKDYFHVYLNQFAATSLDIMLYCFVETPDWSTELRERHRLLLDIIRLARKLKVEFAFPTQTVYLRQEEMPRHDDTDNPEQAMRLGRSEADAIVRSFTGVSGTIPPPVTFDHSPAPENISGEFDSAEDGEGD